MLYEPTKEKIAKFIGDNRFYRKVFYVLLDIFILRQWYVKRVIKKYISQNKEILFFDAGAGFCQYSDFVLSKYKNARVCAVDLNIKSAGNGVICSALGTRETFLNIATFPEAERINPFPTEGKSFLETQSRIVFVQANLESFKLTVEKADFVIAIDILEHIPDDISVLRNFYESMNEEGYLLISTPSNLDSAAAFTEEHVRLGYSLEELTEKVETRGFTVIEHKYSYGFWGKLYWKLIMRNGVIIANNKILWVVLPIYLALVFLPSLVFMLLDMMCKNKSGNGIILVAKKVVDKKGL